VRSRSIRLAFAVLAAGALAAVAWLGWRRLAAERAGGSAVERLEQALRGPGSFALLDVDLAQLRRLLGTEGARFQSALLAAVGLAEAGPAGEVSRVMLVLSRESAEVELSALLLGRFDVGALETALRRSAAQASERSARAGERALYLERVDAQSCRESRSSVALAPDRIVIAAERSLDALLDRLAQAGREPLDDPDEPLLRVQATGALALPAGVGDSAWEALLAAVRELLGANTRIRAQIRADRRGPLALELVLDSTAAERAELARRWDALRTQWRTGGDRGIPALSRWAEALELTPQGAALLGRARLDGEAADLRQLADDAVALASVAFAAVRSDPAAAQAWPVEFRDSQPLASLPSYRSEELLAGAADAIAGPFGVRVERATRRGALELDLRAIGPDLPNAPAPLESPRLVVDSVQGADGSELLDPAQPCGPARADLPQPLIRSSPAPLIEAHKTLRLRPDKALDDVGELRGHIQLDLAVRTQRVVARELRAGQTLELGGTALELRSVGSHGVAYRVRGDPAAVLFVRGLDAAGTPLAAREAWQAALPVSGQRIGALRHAGELAALEVVFALERARGGWPFALTSARPGSDGEAILVESSSFIDYAPEQYDREFHARRAGPRPGERRFLAWAAAGPFQVGLVRLGAAGGVAPQLTVIAPDIPNLTYDASGLELRLERLVLRERGPLALRVRAPVAPGHRFGRLEIEGDVELATDVAAASSDVERLAGELVLRLPARVELLELARVEPGERVAAGPVSFELEELSRDGFALRMRGPLRRFFSARAFGDADRELAVELGAIGKRDAGRGRELRFRVQGVPRRIALQLAHGSATRHYPFELVLPASVPAAPAP
jgi:hypothetical protein